MRDSDAVAGESVEAGVITIMTGELADKTGAVSQDGPHLTAISMGLLGGAIGEVLRIGQGVLEPSELIGEGSDVASNPLTESFNMRSDWFGFGELPGRAATDGSWIVMIRGRLLDPTTARAAHDAVAEVGAGPMREMGDISHLPFTGVEDSSQFLSIDVWDNDRNIELMYGNPDVTAGFMQLFAETPVLQVYRVL